ERAGHAARRAGVRSPRDSAQSAIEGEHPMAGAVFDRSSHPAPTSHPEFYRTPLVYPDVPFHEMLARTAPRVPDPPAIYWRDIPLPYAELEAVVRSAGGGLRALGLRKGDRLCLLMANRPEYAIAWLAASMLGVVLSPMNPSYKEREVGYQLANCEAVAILVQ